MKKKKINLIKAYINKNFNEEDLDLSIDYIDRDNIAQEDFKDGIKYGNAMILYKLAEIIENILPENLTPPKNWLD